MVMHENFASLCREPLQPERRRWHFGGIFQRLEIQTGWFVESILTQTLIVHVIRTNRIPFIDSRASASLTLTTLLVMAVGIFLPYSPLAGYLGFVRLPGAYWGWIVVTLIAYVSLAHNVKSWFVRKFGTD